MCQLAMHRCPLLLFYTLNLFLSICCALSCAVGVLFRLAVRSVFDCAEDIVSQAQLTPTGAAMARRYGPYYTPHTVLSILSHSLVRHAGCTGTLVNCSHRECLVLAASSFCVSQQCISFLLRCPTHPHPYLTSQCQRPIHRDLSKSPRYTCFSPLVTVSHPLWQKMIDSPLDDIQWADLRVQYAWVGLYIWPDSVCP